MKLTKKKAKELSLIKWKWLAETGSSLNGFLREHELREQFDKLWANCPLCEIYGDRILDEIHCKKCILYKKENCCFDDDSLYHQYQDKKCVKNKKIAQKIVDIIESWDIK